MKPKLVSPQTHPLFEFAADMTRVHAREIMLAKPEPIFPPDRSTVAEEYFTEGRIHRHKSPTPQDA